MSVAKWISPLAAFCALYDGLLGLLFLCFPLEVFQRCGVTPPNHVGYVQFPAALLLIFAWIFLQIARNPVGNRSLIPLGVLLKVAYCGVTGWHWIATDIPGMWKPFVMIDLAMGIALAIAYVSLGRLVPSK